MRTVHMFVDESGSVGYGDKKEQTPGELGVMAGFLTTTTSLTMLNAELATIHAAYSTAGKLHITDLEAADQEALRTAIFDLLLRTNTYWTFAAAYVAGFHRHSELTKTLLSTARNAQTGEIRVSTHVMPELLHAHLFQGLFAKGLEWAMEYGGPEVTLQVTTDRVDSQVLKEFNTAADVYLAVGQPKRSPAPGFNIKTKEKVTGVVESHVAAGGDLLGDYSKVKHSIAMADSPLTLAADVLANSLLYYLKAKQDKAMGIPLNAIETIAEHPLARLAFGLATNDGPPDIVDSLFGHPDRPPAADRAPKE